ncbi:YfgM family protein [Candidatus Endomicrobiellum trichonymphae]|uniref:YfgM family protein n=2 Tax=Endomicrobium trichonymphae TaxID=1408204 RepID=B1GYV5_ENDTX|nr:YfgM family protein [Candidatus Endomicrobium trichonymphae]
MKMHSISDRKSIGGIISGFVVKQAKGNKTKFFAVVAFALTIIFIGIFILRLHAFEEASSAKLAAAYASFMHGDKKSGTALIDEMIAKFPKTSAAYHARLIKADFLTEILEYDEALKILTEIVNNGKSDAIKSLAHARIIYIYDSKKDYLNAALVSKEFIAKYPDHFLTRDIYLNLAEYYILSGSKDEAAEVFNEVLVNFPATRAAESARNRFNQIK